ncbi:MAG TPA: bifunctional diaminohydroxyphosphoribosylaminopyrimidine deaminase/5-amino-6-(5-phosphoribosylamino)uracil reductase RibD [Candidatus Dormibacteraeota bacterium]|nr:bifunctional diaminohydroxyphosphoribosylaminopyrimidine deaminase/5-amino-6-(5-phosphoribosylamino)uracil reductase RibD [Candidatus Dormibacteraeota bacterium]
MSVTSRDVELMAEALDLAATADYHTSPNPMVGALIVRDGKVIARGVHRKAGGDHAEVEALRLAGDAARGADMYVTQEPCSHFGRTPPCTDAVIAAGVRRVVVGMQDPNPKVNGQGIQALRSAGIVVDAGVLDDRAKRLNEFFVKHVTTGIPFVTAKFAMSLDGRIATHTGESKWITSEQAREQVHRLRHAHDAILVGANTVIRDDPNLTTRLPGRDGRSPLRIVVDSRLRIPPDARIFNQESGEVLIATSDRARGDRLREFEQRGVPVVVLPAAHGKVGLPDLLRHLGRRDVISMLIEGGSSMHGSAFDQRLVDKVVAFIAPKVIGGVEAPGAVGGHGVDHIAEVHELRDVEVRQLGPDIVVTGYTQ